MSSVLPKVEYSVDLAGEHLDRVEPDPQFTSRNELYAFWQGVLTLGMTQQGKL